MSKGTGLYLVDIGYVGGKFVYNFWQKKRMVSSYYIQFTYQLNTEESEDIRNDTNGKRCTVDWIDERR